MKKFVLIVSVVLCFMAFAVVSGSKEKAVPEKAIAQTLLKQVDDFSASKNKMLAALQADKINQRQLQQLFLETRLAYKKMEWGAEYFAPTISRLVNGAPVVEVEGSNKQILEPAGLQVIEGFVFPTYDASKKGELIRQLNGLEAACNRYKAYFTNIDLLDWQIFDATKLEVFRLETTGITGYDNPLTLKSMAECSASLQSIKEVLSCYNRKGDAKRLSEKIERATQYLQSNHNFDQFDRAAFITEYANPVTIAISDLEKKMGIHVIRYNRLLNQDAKTLFDSGAFNVNAYAPDESAFVTAEKVTLGKKLFADPILSGNNQRSCQSCHQPDKAFTDGIAKNTVFGTTQLLKRNTPSLINTAFQPSQFYDLRVKTLEDQSGNVIQNPEEMHGSLTKAAKRLWENETYRKLFQIAFPKPGRTGIDTFEVVNALGSYVRSIVSLDSRLDEYMRGNKGAMNSEEINGFNLFMGKAKCGTCHYMPLFNGTLPPRYMKMESEVIGAPKTTPKNIYDDDLGRFEIIQHASLKRAFKTPTVRNTGRTAPYMHNGVFSTLDEVVDFYNKGGGKGLGMQIENQTLSSEKLNLSKKECGNIIRFIKALNTKQIY